MRNIRLDICYDGSRYKGWQRLANRDDTIQGKIETVLSRILEEPIEISGSGRTDAGVHARDQVANFHCENVMPTEKILQNLRAYLPEDIGILACQEVNPRFHARLNAREKTYRYRIWNSEKPNVFLRKYMAKYPEKLDLKAMTEAGRLLCGEHDFSAFCATPRMKKSTVRNLKAVEIQKSGEEISISYTADGFLYNMVRILTGTLLEVGTGKRDAQSVMELFGKKRECAGFLAPAQGLCLEEVKY